MAGISRATLFRWISRGIIEDVPLKDRRGWRLFSQLNIDMLKAESGRTSSEKK